MITLIHGTNTIASRQELTNLREKAKDRDIRAIDGRGIDETTLTEAVATQSLFGTDMLIVIENLFSPIGRKVKLIRAFGEILKEAAHQADIVVWEPKEVGKEPVTALGTACEVKYFTIPPVIFELLDSLTPDAKKFLKILPRALENDAAERIQYMLLDRIRNLLQLKDNVRPARVSPYQMTRLTQQARAFTMSQLQVFHNNLVANDFAMKTGRSPFSTRQSMELSLIGIRAD